MSWTYQYIPQRKKPQAFHPRCTRHHIIHNNGTGPVPFVSTNSTTYNEVTAALYGQLGPGIELWNDGMIIDKTGDQVERFLPSRINIIVPPVWEVFNLCPFSICVDTNNQALLALLVLK